MDASGGQPRGRPRFDLAFLLGAEGWPYLLVPFIPIAVALDLANAGEVAIFFTAALGVIPTAALMGRAPRSWQRDPGPEWAAF